MMGEDLRDMWDKEIEIGKENQTIVELYLSLVYNYVYQLQYVLFLFYGILNTSEFANSFFQIIVYTGTILTNLRQDELSLTFEYHSFNYLPVMQDLHLKFIFYK